MISDRRRQIIRFLLILIFSQIFAGMQTSLWTHLFGTITPPAFWLMLIIYVALFRQTAEGVVSLFFMSFSLSVYTSLPEGMLTLNLLAIFTGARFLKSRVFIPTTTYFAATSSLAVIGFFVVHTLLSYIFDTTPDSHFEFLPIFTQIVLTFVFSIPVFALLQVTDHFFKDDAKDTWDHEFGGLGR